MNSPDIDTSHVAVRRDIASELSSRATSNVKHPHSDSGRDHPDCYVPQRPVERLHYGILQASQPTVRIIRHFASPPRYDRPYWALTPANRGQGGADLGPVRAFGGRGWCNDQAGCVGRGRPTS